MNELSTIDDIANTFWDVMKPSEVMNVVECAERYRMLSQEASEKKGAWDTSIVPYTRFPMEMFTHPEVKEIICCWASQTGKTEVELNCIHWTIVCDPGPTTVSYAQKGSAEDDFAAIRLEPMIRDSKILPSLFFEGKVKGYKRRNKKMFKSYIGGYVRCIGTSEAELSSRPTKYFFFDELSRGDGHNKGGSIFHLGKKRTQNYYKSKVMVASSPGDEDTCPTWDLYQNSKRYQLRLSCPHCKDMIALVWDQVRYQDARPDTAYYECQSCKKPINDDQKVSMLQKFEWVCLDPDRPMYRIGTNLSALYSPWVKFSQLVLTHLDAIGNPKAMKTFTNTDLGLPYKGDAKTADSAALVARREAYLPELPEGVLFITAGVDVNDFGLAVEVVGWGHGEESWSIDYRILHGTPTKDDVWDQLEDLLKIKYRHAWGVSLPIGAMGIDTGYLLEKTSKFIKKFKGRRVFGLKGDGRDGRPIVGPVMKSRTGIGERKIPIYPVGTNEAKTLLYDRLVIDEAGEEYCHFPFNGIYNQQFFKELTAEKIVVESDKRGFPVQKFVKPDHLRNEPLDCRVYAHAVLRIVRPHFSSVENRLIELRTEIEEILSKKGAKDESAAQEKIEAERAPRAVKRKPPPRTVGDVLNARPVYKPERRRNFNW